MASLSEYALQNRPRRTRPSNFCLRVAPETSIQKTRPAKFHPLKALGELLLRGCPLRISSIPLPENRQRSRIEQARRTTVEHHRSRVAPLPNPLVIPKLHRICFAMSSTFAASDSSQEHNAFHTARCSRSQVSGSPSTNRPKLGSSTRSRQAATRNRSDRSYSLTPELPPTKISIVVTNTSLETSVVLHPPTPQATRA
jgi:hypothetical protein